jgi:dTDP-4-amino-4,6-dideoxygalactose transaminase
MDFAVSDVSFARWREVAVESVTEQVSRTLLRLPIYPQLSSSDQEYVIEALLAWLQQV